MFNYMQTLEQKIDDLALAVKEGFESVDRRFEDIDKRFESIDRRFNVLPDKDYLDDKLADLKGDLIVKLRREDEKVNFLIDLLRARSVLNEKDVERLRKEFEIFPRMA